MCVSVYLHGIFMHHMHAVPLEARRKCPIPWSWSYIWLQATMWRLRIQLKPFRKHPVTAEPSLQQQLKNILQK